MKTDIFGNRPQEYKHLMEAQKRFPQEYARKISQSKMFDGMDFDVRKPRSSMMDDSISIGYLQSNLESIQAQIEEVLYTGGMRYRDWLPINSNIPEGATSYSYRIVDKYGKADFIENGGTNVNGAGISVTKAVSQIKLGGILPQWSYEDLRSAQFDGVPLDSEIIDAATMSCSQHIEKVWLGTDGQFEGLLNNSDVTVATATTPFDQLTPTQVIGEIQGYIGQIIGQTQEVFGRIIKDPLALYVDVDMEAFLSQPRSDTTDTTIWDFVKSQNSWTRRTGQELKMIVIEELVDAGVSSTHRMMFGYPTSKLAWEAGLPISPRARSVFQQPYVVQVPMEYKLSPVNFKRPGGFLYVDNVLTATP